MRLLHRGLAFVEQGGLVVVFREPLRFAPHLVDGAVVLIDPFREGDEALGAGLKGTAAPQRIRLIGHPSAGDGLTMHAVALIVVHRGQRGVDRNFVKVGASQPRDLGVHVRMYPPVQQRVIAEIDARHHMRGAKGDLFCLGEKVVGIPVQNHAPDRLDRDEFLGDELGRIQHVETELLRVRLAEQLHAELPFGIVAGFDRLP